MIRHFRPIAFSVALVGAALASSTTRAIEIQGDYLESRTCDVYTGPCFANGEVGLTGELALLAWNVERGAYNGVDLSGLKVVMAVRAENTLAFGGGMAVDPGRIEAVVLVDERANAEQREALAAFAQAHAGNAAGEVVRVKATPIEMQTDHVNVAARLNAGRDARLETRKIAATDRCCTNEEIFYPPLTKVDNAEPAYTIDGGFSGRGLGAQWSNPASRSSFVATFAY